MLYLKNFVYWRLRFITLGNWDWVKDLFTKDPTRVKKDIDAVTGLIESCVENLKIPRDTVEKAQASATIKAYTEYEIQSLQIEDWFR